MSKMRLGKKPNQMNTNAAMAMAAATKPVKIPSAILLEMRDALRCRRRSLRSTMGVIRWIIANDMPLDVQSRRARPIFERVVVTA